jgi:5-methylthioadenosine/S-adenosylhomocysteine deaminase
MNPTLSDGDTPHADQAAVSLIDARWVIPVVPARQVLEDHAVVLSDGAIVAVMPVADAVAAHPHAERVSLPGHALIPGLVNAHTHAAMTLLRGFADDKPLDEWLSQHIWPAEARLVGERFVRDGSALAVAEMLRGGVTCFNDMYFFADETAEVAQSAGMRACVGLITLDFPTVWARDADEYLAKAAAVHDRCRDLSLVSTAFAPHAPYTVSDEPLRRIASLAEELDVPIHMHVHETAREVQDSLDQHGKRPLQRLQDLGLLSPRLAAVHLCAVDDSDLDLLQRGGVHALHCPESNLKLASGLCPVAQLLERGINVAIGTDGTASNNDLDVLGEARTAALLAKGVSGNAAAMPAHAALEAATLGGARALALDDRTGSLEKGKRGDITAIDLQAPETLPLYDPISHIVYAASRRQVTDVWVDGERVLQAGRLTQMDEADIMHRAQRWTAEILGHDAP